MGENRKKNSLLSEVTAGELGPTCFILARLNLLDRRPATRV